GHTNRDSFPSDPQRTQKPAQHGGHEHRLLAILRTEIDIQLTVGVAVEAPMQPMQRQRGLAHTTRPTDHGHPRPPATGCGETIQFGEFPAATGEVTWRRQQLLRHDLESPWVAVVDVHAAVHDTGLHTVPPTVPVTVLPVPALAPALSPVPVPIAPPRWPCLSW